MSKNFEQLFFQQFFRFFEVCSSGDLVDFLEDVLVIWKEFLN